MGNAVHNGGNIMTCLGRLARFVCVMGFSTLAGGLVSGNALAQVVVPGDAAFASTIQYDRATPPADHYFWRNLLLGSNNTGSGPVYGGLSLLCLSNTDSRNGRCSTVITGQFGTSTIPLRFTERRSRLSVELNLRGYNRRNFPGSICGAWSPSHLLSSNIATLCEDRTISIGTDSSLWIPQSELAKIPSGGIWDAQLIMRLRYSSSTMWTYTADITLDVTDKNNIAVYLPAFGNATPLVDLNLRTQPLAGSAGGQVSGRANLDMCLYDGHNANSTWYEVRVSDTLPAIPGRPVDHFSVLRDVGGGVTDARNRVDYGVTMQYNGASLTLRNNEMLRLTGVDSAQIRAVSLPGIPFPVVCTPTPMTLTTPAFHQIDKISGRYSGTLRVEFTPSAEMLR